MGGQGWSTHLLYSWCEGYILTTTILACLVIHKIGCSGNRESFLIEERLGHSHVSRPSVVYVVSTCRRVFDSKVFVHVVHWHWMERQDELRNA